MTSTDNSSSTILPPLERAIASLEGAEQLDRAREIIAPAVERVGDGALGSALRGEWLGHALHPLMTDFPLGCWLAAGLLDVTAPRKHQKAAQRLIGLGLVFTVPTALAGMADYSEVDEPRTRRVGVVHAAGNTAVALMYLVSWRSRRRGHHIRGMGWAMAGGLGAWVTGYLGGHLSFGRRVGTGLRGMPEGVPRRDPSAVDAEPEVLVASGATRVTVAGVTGFEGPNSL